VSSVRDGDRGQGRGTCQQSHRHGGRLGNAIGRGGGDVLIEAALVREEMTGAMKLSVPLKVEVVWGKNWQEVK
jgi:hypothetical protein